MKVLVTTPNGKVGSEVVKQLSSKAELRLGAHTPDKVKPAFPGKEVVRLDYTDPATIKAALSGVEAVYLASPGDSPADPEKQLIDAAKAAGIRRIVKLSAINVEKAPDAVPIRQVEKHLEASGLDWTILRPNWFMQNFTTMHAQALRSGTLAEPAGQARCTFIDTRDIAAVAVKALTEKGYAGKSYTLTGAEALTREEVCREISKVTGKTVKYVSLSDDQFRKAMQGLIPAGYVELLSALYATVRAGAVEQKTDAVQQILGRAPSGFARFAEENRKAWL
jgi:uncharacterized protein YbjT (DUF2867 family)